MKRARLGRSRKMIPAALAIAGCRITDVTDAGCDAGVGFRCISCAEALDAGLVASCDDDAGYDAGLTDAGTDAGTTDAGTTDAGCNPTGDCAPYLNACGMNCGCVTTLNPDGGLGMMGYCDPDIGNPCPLGCFNPREADGGRQYMSGNPVCYC